MSCAFCHIQARQCKSCSDLDLYTEIATYINSLGFEAHGKSVDELIAKLLLDKVNSYPPKMQSRIRELAVRRLRK